VRVSFNELAERELNEAAQFYEQQRPGLGAAFVDEVQRCSAVALDHPQSGQLVAGTIRRLLCRRFPYGVLYAIKEDEVRILAVMNLRRRPGYWVGRT
jgi:toxin ParE1/3/4